MLPLEKLHQLTRRYSELDELMCRPDVLSDRNQLSKLTKERSDLESLVQTFGRYRDIEKKLNSAVFPGSQGGPLEHVIAAKAVCFKEALQPEFKAYQQQVVKNAKAMAGVFIERGFDVVSGGTENHLFLLSLIKQDISGKDADAALGRAFITVNKNSVPNDPRSPFVTSGLRFGTPAVTTRGFKEAECKELAGWICDILADLNNEAVIDAVREKVKAICAKLPVYGA